MQKRRSIIPNTLPITASDEFTNQSDRKWNKVAHRNHDNHLSARSLLSILASAFIFLLLKTVLKSITADDKSIMQERLIKATYQKYFKPDYELRPLPLTKFKSLDYALAHSELIGLYFAASWCKMSTPVSNLLEEVFAHGTTEDQVLPRESIGVSNGEKRSLLAIVYVSSDESEEEMNNYSRENWINVPFKSSERDALKRYFQVCAKPELEELNMLRKFEIPTLIIIDSLTQGILTTSGHLDLEKEGINVLDKWLSLRDSIRSLEEKYQD